MLMGREGGHSPSNPPITRIYSRAARTVRANGPQRRECRLDGDVAACHRRAAIDRSSRGLLDQDRTGSGHTRETRRKTARTPPRERTSSRSRRPQLPTKNRVRRRKTSGAIQLSDRDVFSIVHAAVASRASPARGRVRRIFTTQ